MKTINDVDVSVLEHIVRSHKHLLVAHIKMYGMSNSITKNTMRNYKYYKIEYVNKLMECDEYVNETGW